MGLARIIKPTVAGMVMINATLSPLTTILFKPSYFSLFASFANMGKITVTIAEIKMPVTKVSILCA